MKGRKEKLARGDNTMNGAIMEEEEQGKKTAGDNFIESCID